MRAWFMALMLVACGASPEVDPAGHRAGDAWGVASEALPFDLPGPQLSAPVVFGMDLHVSPAILGGELRATVTGAQPNANVWLLVSASVGASACPPQIAPACLDLGSPFYVLTSVRASAAGDATFVGTVPEGLTWDRAEFQAVAFGGGVVGLSVPRWRDILDPRECRPGAVVSSLPVRELAALGYGEWDLNDPYFQPDSTTGLRLLHTQAEYAELQAVLGRPLPSNVSFPNTTVAVIWAYRSSTCGLNMGDVSIGETFEGTVQAQFDIETADGCTCSVCDAIGAFLHVYDLGQPAPVAACVDWIGPACDLDTANTDTCF